MTYKNICTKREWTTRDGEKKVKWLTVGTLKITDEGKQFIQLNMFPDTTFYVFDQKEKDEGLL